jgi:hypothetical protein
VVPASPLTRKSSPAPPFSVVGMGGEAGVPGVAASSPVADSGATPVQSYTSPGVTAVQPGVGVKGSTSFPSEEPPGRFRLTRTVVGDVSWNRTSPAASDPV